MHGDYEWKTDIWTGSDLFPSYFIVFLFLSLILPSDFSVIFTCSEALAAGLFQALKVSIKCLLDTAVLFILIFSR